MAEYTQKQVEAMKDEMKRLYGRLSNLKEEAKEAMGYVRQTMEVGLATFGAAYALGKWGGPELSISVVGVPVELGGALVLKAVAFTGLLGEYTSDAHNLGDGFLAVYLSKKGFSLGRAGGQWSQGASPTVAGALPPHHNAGPLTPEQMARAMAG